MASPPPVSQPSGTRGRVVLQQCLSAKLMIQPATNDKLAQYVQIRRGMVAFICFLKGADDETVDKMVKSVLGVRLSTAETGNLLSVKELPGDLLIEPQATLGGKPRGKRMQYHSNIEKDNGRQLYTHFCQQCESAYKDDTKCQELGTAVQCGTYGNTQVLSTETNGPYTHIIEF